MRIVTTSIVFILVSLCGLSSCVYVPGTPGGPWTQEEQLIVRSKIYKLNSNKQGPQTLRLAFHDCLKYADGTGGCDGCLNWEGVGVRFNAQMYKKANPIVEKTNNNGLAKIVEELEKIYTETDYPKYTPVLAKSLKDTGKSRADLWAFASIVSVEFGMELNNIACDDMWDPRVIQTSATCMHLEGQEGCKINPSRKIKFQTGRIDCISQDSEEPYKTTKEESHPNPVANGKATIEFFKSDFGYNGRETAAIFGAHTYGKPTVQVSLFPYTWTSRNLFVFNNDYYKNIVGLDRWFFNSNECEKVGDAYGNIPKTQWLAHSRKFTVRGGPTMWLHRNHACPDKYNLLDNPTDEKCVQDVPEGLMCHPDRENGEPDPDIYRGCERFRFISGFDEIALNCEMGLYREFEVTDGVLHGCPGLELFNKSMASDDQHSIFSKINKKVAEPLCEKQRLAEPAGSTPLYQIMEEFAHNQTAWINTYIPTMEKMISNGYDKLEDATEPDGEVECPIPPENSRDPEPCYIKRKPMDMEAFMIGNRKLIGKVYQYNSDINKFDFAAQTGADNQLWKVAESGTQLINMATMKPLKVDANVEWNFQQQDDGDYSAENPTTGLYLDCGLAKNPGQPCKTKDGTNKEQQRFFMIPSV